MKTLLKRKMQHFAMRSTDFLNKRTESFSQAKKKTMLALFCILSFVFSMYIIATSVTVHGKSGPAFIIPRTSLPVHIGKSFPEPEPYISKETFERVEYFKEKLDSIARTDTATFNKLTEARPHLMDSIVEFEKLYYSQPKK
jgi:hypothetical protein